MPIIFTKDDRLHVENIHLRRKLEKMESEGYIFEMKKKYDAELAKKDKNIARLNKKLAKYTDRHNDDLKKISKYKLDNELKDVKIFSVTDELIAMTMKNVKLEGGLAERDEIIKKLKAQINRTIKTHLFLLHKALIIKK